jgi:hypothetical protein
MAPESNSQVLLPGAAQQIIPPSPLRCNEPGCDNERVYSTASAFQYGLRSPILCARLAESCVANIKGNIFGYMNASTVRVTSGPLAIRQAWHAITAKSMAPKSTTVPSGPVIVTREASDGDTIFYSTRNTVMVTNYSLDNVGHPSRFRQSHQSMSMITRS